MKDEKSKMREIKASDYKYKPITPPEPPQIDCDGTETLSPEEQYSLPLLPDKIIEQEIPPERPQIDYDGTVTPSPEEQYTLPLLPDEIIEQEILPRLPVKSLLRFRCVSKSWRSIIDSRRFVENHYRNSMENTSLASHRAIFNWKFQETRLCSLQSMLDRTSVHPSPFDEEADNKSITRYAYIMGCCNGLFYLVTYDKGHFFWNPATKKFFKLPQIAKKGLPFYTFRRIMKRGFCWDETASAYKVFAVLYDPRVRRNVARVYSSKMNSWTAVKVGSLSLYDEVGVHVNGYFHWIAKKNGNHPCYIETFDLRRWRFGKIGMPLGEVDGFSNLRLGEVRGCIALLREVDRDTDLWVMKEHGVEESWEKLVRVRGYCYEGRRLFSTPCGETILVAGRNFLAFRDGNGVARSKRISHGEEEAKSEEGREGWFSSLKGLLRSCYEDCYPSIRGKDYFNYHTYFYVESLVSPFPTTSC